jgi:hypothetical protein
MIIHTSFSSTYTTEIQRVRKVDVHFYKVLEVTSTSVYTGLNPSNFIRKNVLQICIPIVAVHLQTLLKVMSMSLDTGLNLNVP